MPDRSNQKQLRAVVIGLGQVGSRFDEEPGRKSPWSHVGAYLHLAERYRLVGAAEISRDNAAAFSRRCPDIPVYGSVAELIEAVRPQVASIATPAEAHAEALAALLQCDALRLVWCEKPLSHDFAVARQMVESCAARGVRLMVSYNRHWSPLWRRARALIGQGSLGKIRSVRVAMPNRILSVGSHCVDLLMMLAGDIEQIASVALPALDEEGEAAITAALRFRSGAGGVMQVTGRKSQLVVEAEIFGDDGRMWVREDRGSIMIEPFAPSVHYAGYRQLGAGREEIIPDDISAFVAMAENAADAITAGRDLECDGAHALEVQRILGLLTTECR
jgi:predicted dehydrogenase